MNSIDFCYWLQGYFELSDVKMLDAKRVEILKNHLNLVFKHEMDPLRERETTTSVDVLNEVHSGIYKPINDELLRC